MPLTKKQEQILDGVMLGDRCIASRAGRNARLQYGCKEEELAQYVANEFSSYSMRDPYPRGGGPDWRKETRLFFTYSSGNPVFTAQRRRWYPLGTKTVPEDLTLTSRVCLFWYLGDGGLQNCNGRGTRVSLSTHGFSDQDVALLGRKLAQIGFCAKTYPDGGKPRMYISDQVREWLAFIGPSPVACMERRWGPIKDKHHSWLSERVREDIVSLSDQGLTQYAIASKVGVAQSTVSRFLGGRTYAG